jgi:hypothetical protein
MEVELVSNDDSSIMFSTDGALDVCLLPPPPARPGFLGRPTARVAPLATQ